MEFERKHDGIPDSVPEVEGEDIDYERLLLKPIIRQGLNTIQATFDGKSFAYVRLDLQGKRLRTLQGDLSCYGELKHVNLASNEISEGLDALSQLPNLVTLTIQRNKVKSLPDLSLNRSLQIIQADFNEITTLSEFRAPSLFAMTASHNKISSLQDLQQDFPNCESLDLSYNQFTSLSGIERFHSLRHLNVSRNGISSLAPLAKLTKLQTLDLSYNKLKDVSELKYLSHISSLSTITIHRNPELRPPPSIDPTDLALEILLILPQIKCIDSRIITVHERASASRLKRARDEEAAFRLASAESEKAVQEAEARAVAAKKLATEAEARSLRDELGDGEDGAGEGEGEGEGYGNGEEGGEGEQDDGGEGGYDDGYAQGDGEGEGEYDDNDQGYEE